MGKKILIITGSPRNNGNSNKLAQSLSSGAIKKGHTVNTFNTVKKKIDGCIACYTCWSKGTPCSFISDNFDELSTYLENADIVVFSTPLYWGSFSSQLKGAIDRFYPYTTENALRKLKPVKSILLASAASDQMAFNGLITQFYDINYYLGWEVEKILTVPLVDKIDDIDKTEALNKAYNIGFNI